jgi:hypothetical protein
MGDQEERMHPGASQEHRGSRLLRPRFLLLVALLLRLEGEQGRRFEGQRERGVQGAEPTWPIFSGLESSPRWGKFAFPIGSFVVAEQLGLE